MQRERLEQAGPIQSCEAAPELSDIEKRALLQGHRPAQGGFADPAVAREVDTSHRIRGSRPHAGGDVHPRPAGIGRRRAIGVRDLQFRREIKPAA
jgi:hypothetical protein